MEHCMHCVDVYIRIHKILKVGGIQSHYIGFDAHGVFPPHANGHYGLTRRQWEKLVGFRDPIRANLNCLPPSFHRAVMADLGSEISLWQPNYYSTDEQLVAELAPDTLIPESEANIRDCYVEAVKMK